MAIASRCRSLVPLCKRSCFSPSYLPLFAAVASSPFLSPAGDIGGLPFFSLLPRSKNLVAGTKYLEIIGESIISNTRTGDRAVLDFKEGSSWSGASGRNKIEGKVFDATGKLRAELVGRWDECVDRKKGGKEFNRIWEANGWDKSALRFLPISSYPFSHSSYFHPSSLLQPSFSACSFPSQRARTESRFVYP